MEKEFRLRCLFWLLLAFIIISPGFAVDRETLTLKKQIYTDQSAVSLNQICEEDTDIEAYFVITESGYLSNRTVALQLAESGYSGYTLIGKGIDVVLLGNGSASQSLSDWVTAEYPDIDLVSDYPDLGDGSYITGVDFVKNDTQFAMNIQYVKLINGKSVVTNLVWKSGITKPKKVIVTSEKADDFASDFHIESIDGTSANLIYQKGMLTIRTVGEIIEELDDGYYLVENTTSGKQIKVKLLSD